METRMKILSRDNLSAQRFILGPWETNCYVVSDRGSAPGECWIIDAGFDPEEMIAWIQSEGLRPSRLILTHGHADHIAGVPDCRRAFGEEMTVSIHSSEWEFMTNSTLNLSVMAGMNLNVGESDEFTEDGDSLALGDHEFAIIHTPGHSPGGITIFEAKAKVAFVGDTLFCGSIGRYDFPTSDGRLLVRSIREGLFELPNDTEVLPGHGPATTIGEEKKSNPFVGMHAPTMF